MSGGTLLRKETKLKKSHKMGCWECFGFTLTLPFCSCCLSACGMSDSNVQRAWREKIALCFIILLVSAALGFLTFGFSTIACSSSVAMFPVDVTTKHNQFANPEERLMIIKGRLYRLGPYFEYGFHRPIEPITDLELAPVVRPLYGQDISEFFPPNIALSKCKYWPPGITSTTCNLPQKYPNVNRKLLHCHRSVNSIRTLQRFFHGYLSYSWENITNSDGLFVVNNVVYDIGDYLKSDANYLGDGEVKALLAGLVGRDATRDFAASNFYDKLMPCLEEQFRVGEVHGMTVGCLATNLLVVLSTAILVLITLIKFFSALCFDWFLSWKLGSMSKRSKNPHVIVLVTAYSENIESLKTTFDSIAKNTYENKLLFVVADGLVKGSGNAYSTPELCLQLMTRIDNVEPEPKSYLAIGDGPKQHNKAQVYVGHYEVDDYRIPYLLLVKCGTEQEKSEGGKPGNRGKRDSQLILMHFFSKVCFSDRINPLEFTLIESFKQISVSPENFELILMVDADTQIMSDSMGFMASAMERDPHVMGLCGETRIANKASSWVTMIQVYEYYISHHLSKAFESIFGGVTCLPGCFCMYRIKVKKEDYWVPILANPDIVQMYASNDVSTLHKKNLLLLGEDRYLTTLMLRAFPHRKMIFVPKAVCKTVVPEEFKVLLSQRRRWINSTIHNLLELILVPQLCGTFCCSMQFLIFLELVGTVILPAALLFLMYLILAASFGADVWVPLIFMAAFFLLQSLLILMTSRKVVYIIWMIIFIIAMPVWNFVLPIYAFWHFDDFTWGKTRKTDGPDGHTEAVAAQEAAVAAVPTKSYAQWRREAKRIRNSMLHKQQRL